MSKLYQTLEQVFKMRINSNSEIIPYIKKLAEMGKFDEPKKIAAIAILLDRLGKLEDDADMEKSLSDIATDTTISPSTPAETLSSESSEVAATPQTPLQSEPSALEDQISNPNATPIVSTPVEPTSQLEQPVTEAPKTPEETTPPIDTAPTVTEFTPENITDPTPATNDSTTTA